MAKIDIIKASAGSGKTYRLAYCFIKRLLVNPQLFHEVLAVTFTNKATCQMKDRILANLQNLKIKPNGESYIEDLMKDTGMSLTEIQKKAEEAQLYILSDYNRFSISTIDKFFTKIVRSFFNELHKDPSYEVVVSTSELLDQAIVDVILNDSNTPLLEPLFKKRIEAEKNFDIKKDIDSIKSILLNHRPEDFNYEEFRKKFDSDKASLEKTIDDITSKAKYILSYLLSNGYMVEDYPYGIRGYAGNLKQIAEGDDLEIKVRLKKIIDGDPFYGTSLKKKSLGVYLDTIENKLRSELSALDKLIEKYLSLANTIEILNKNIDLIQLIKVIQQQYYDNCQRDHIVAINEMPSIVSDISNNENLAFLYMKIDARLKCIMIDEFQDTSIEQWAGFKPILDEICSMIEDKDSSNLIIGDIKQAIYRWRGGNESLLRKDVFDQFRKYARIDTLRHNYRSKNEIIEFNNLLFKQLTETKVNPNNLSFDGKDEIIEDINSLISETYSDSKQYIGKDKKGGYVECIKLSAEESVSELVVDKIRNEILTDGYYLKDIAVIVRNNKDAYEIAELFSRNNIEFISGESLLLANSRIVQLINVLLHLAKNPENVIMLTAYNLSRGNPIDTKLNDDTIEILKEVSSQPLIEAVEILLNRLIKEDTSSETAFLDAYLDIIYQKQTNDAMSIIQFLNWWDETGKNSMLSSPEGQNAVTIITIHKAKGLEYPVVIAPMVNWELNSRYEQKFLIADESSDYHKFGPMPIPYSNKCYNSCFRKEYLKERKQEIIDNINLLYVLTTRAKDRLYLICPEKKSNGYKGIDGILLGALMGNSEQKFFNYGTKSIADRDEMDTNEIIEKIESINPIKFERPLSKSSTIIENGTANNLIQGILMHKVLSSIESLDELEDSVKIECEIESENLEKYIPLINKIRSNKEVQKWFMPNWNHYCERGIMIPGLKGQKRPDRVIVDGNKAIVIDYKFGLRKLEKYTNQVLQYMELVSKIGYSDVSGRLYYVSLDEIEII